MGLNTAIIQITQEICFVIPVNTARWVVSALIQEGRVRRGYLGIAGQNVPVDPRLVQEHQLAGPTGVGISAVAPRSPARRAGLRPGDVVVSLDDTPTPTIDHIHRLLTHESLRRHLPLVLLREGRLFKVTVDPQEAPPQFLNAP